jgi:Kef-type K+ transport system membrane component KefB
MIAATLLQAQAPMVTNPVAIFLVVLAIILIVPLLLQRIKLPYVIGLILAGVAVGPHGFNIVGRDMSFEVFGQVGILYLMFLAGLEIDMYHLRRNLRRGLVFGAYTFVIPLVVGLGVGLGLLGLGVKASFLLAAMFAAHTLLAYPIVSRFGLTRNNAVVVAVAGTIFTVVGSLVVLAIVGEVADKGSFSALSLLRVTGYIAVFCLVTILVYPRLTRWFFKRYSDTIAQFVYVLVMVFLAATVAIRLGIEGVFGAFIAGLVLNRYVPLRSALMVRIEFVGNALFIPYFLIGVGMMIDLGVLTRGWGTLYVAAIMSVAAMAAKWLAAFATQKTFGMPALERSILYQLSNAHTAVALAVVTIGLRMNLLGEEILNGTVVMILATCTVSSIGVERASRRLKLRQLRSGADNVAENLEKHPPRTLITVANPITAPSLVELAMMIHQGGKSTPDSPIYALYVRGSDHSDASRAIGRNALSVAEKAAAAVDSTLIPIERYDVSITAGVLNTVAERDISEIIIGLHGRTRITDSFFGQKIEQLVRSTNRMIVVSRCYIPVNTVTRIVVAVPPKAEFETGFPRWVEAMAMIASQLGCRIIFHCHPATTGFVRAVIARGRFAIRAEYVRLDDWDDFVLMSNKILDDDLFVVVNARRASVSFSPELEELPEFLQRNFSRNNLVVIYPEQFGDAPELDATMAAAMSADFTSTPISVWVKLRRLARRLMRH